MMEKSKISDQELNKVSGGRGENERFYCDKVSDNQTFEVFFLRRFMNNECPCYNGYGNYQVCTQCDHLKRKS